MCNLCETSSDAGGIRLPRRHFLKILGAALSVPVGLRAAEKEAPPKPQNVISPDEALDRLDSGDYGICLSCEEPIPVKRLRALPWARYCIPCQESSGVEMDREWSETSTRPVIVPDTRR